MRNSSKMYFDKLVLLFALASAAYCEVVPVTCDLVKQFVTGHNSRRLNVARGEVPNQPPASSMYNMVWDDELAKKASDWAATNQFSHNPDRTIPSGRFSTGENIFSMSTTAPAAVLDVDQALDSWFSEHKYYTYAAYDSNANSVNDIGHYTQMIWSDTVYVGCGVSKQTQSNGFIHFILVCNYGPPGNYIGEFPYESSGSPATGLTCYKDTCNQLYGAQC